MRIEFSPEEVEVLREVLEHKVRDLEVELSRTDSLEFKEKVRHRRNVLEQLLGKLAERPVAGRA